MITQLANCGAVANLFGTIASRVDAADSNRPPCLGIARRTAIKERTIRGIEPRYSIIYVVFPTVHECRLSYIPLMESIDTIRTSAALYHKPTLPSPNCPVSVLVPDVHDRQASLCPPFCLLCWVLSIRFHGFLPVGIPYPGCANGGSPRFISTEYTAGVEPT